MFFVRHGILEVIFPPSKRKLRQMQIIPFRCSSSTESPLETLQNFDLSISRAAIKLERDESTTKTKTFHDLAVVANRSFRYSLHSRRCVVVKDTAVRPERVLKAERKQFACPVPLAQRERRAYPNVLAGMNDIIQQNIERIDTFEPNTVFFDSTSAGRHAVYKLLRNEVSKYEVSLLSFNNGDFALKNSTEQWLLV